jgi:hypothetical protein
LEAQQYYTDVLFGTHNVLGTWDVVGDLVAGLAGTLVYSPLYTAVQRPRRWIG